jgi:hypothetical protein
MCEEWWITICYEGAQIMVKSPGGMPPHFLSSATPRKCYDKRPKCIEPAHWRQPVAMMHPSMLVMRPKSNGV